MKRKLFWITILLTGLILNVNAQEKVNEKATNIRLERRSGVAMEKTVIGRSLGHPIDFSGDMQNNEKRVSLNLSKNFMGETISSKTDFEVAKGQKAVSLSLSGKCSKGEITVTIILPGGDTLENLTITTAADINWSAMLPIKEGEENKYTGKWKLEVKSNGAEGSYNLNISSR
jgi:hypothetical protein